MKNKALVWMCGLLSVNNGFYILYEFFRGRPENLLESF